MYKKIMCPVDFSHCSQIALEHATQLARVHSASLLLVHVTPPPPVQVTGFSGYDAIPPSHPEPDSRLEELSIADLSIPVEREHLLGLEGEVIVKHASNSGCDLIVMGTHGHGGLTRLMLGSVADYVIRHAKCPTYVVKDRAREEALSESMASTKDASH